MDCSGQNDRVEEFVSPRSGRNDRVGLRSCALNAEGARRGRSRLDVGIIKRIELRPEDVAFVAQGLDREFLLGARMRVFVDVLDGEVRILRRLMKTGLEVVEPT